MMAPNERDGTPGRILNVRTLAALDIALHGPRFILAEFGGGVLLCLALGLWLIYAGFPPSQEVSLLRVVTGVYLLLVAANYVPLLVYAFLIARRKRARQEAMAELADKGRYMQIWAAAALSGRTAGHSSAHAYPGATGAQKQPPYRKRSIIVV
jgi:hypothetical protein